MRKTKIVCTIGPASAHSDMIRKLIKGGVNIFRLNCSHGTPGELKRSIATIRRESSLSGKIVGILLDLEGPHVRVGSIKEGAVMLADRSTVILTGETVVGDKKRFSVSYRNLYKDVKRAQRILLDNGEITLKVIKIKGKDIHCRVIEGGLLSSRKSVNIPGASLGLPSLTQKDISHINGAIEEDVDFLGLSFVRDPKDVIKVRGMLKKRGAKCWVIAKIEHPLAVAKIDEIIKNSDGIMIARGDLGVELPTEEVPLIQKQIIKKCNAMGKPVITATQMLESMIENVIPTRAEATDVANAIFDGTDAVMLSGETAIGKHPLLVVEMMEKIIVKTESSIDYNRIFIEKIWARSLGDIPHAVSHATIEAALDLNAKAIITATKSGQTARFISSYRPGFPVYAVTQESDVSRKLNLLWGVTPFCAKKRVKDTDKMISYSIDVVRRNRKITKGDTVVITSGVPTGIAGKTNMMQVHLIN
ncbi:MAG: pyruvate kinase [bacterium]